MLKDLLAHMMSWLSLREQATSAVRVCREWRDAGYIPIAHSSQHVIEIADIPAIDNLLESPLRHKTR
jgi:hypothetical protein